MSRIRPPTNRTLCLRAGELVELETLSELGVYGAGAYTRPLFSST